MINPNNLCPGCMNEKVTEGKCPICGYNPDDLVNPSFLAPGSMLEGRYVIGKVLDSNGEGVTYLGYDTVTAVTVNIREFFPSGLCERDSDGVTVVMLSGNEYSYNNSLINFLKLSRELFRLNEIPALFDVLDVREANNTAYRVVRSVPGISLREFLMRNGGILKWDQARSLFTPLISSISALHKAGIIHRGISPDTIIVGKDGKLRISGFCIAEVRTAKSALTSLLFPGFAAVEQYGAVGTQGAWTDIYAFAATIYRTLVGNPPPEATQRLENDNMTIPAKIARETPKAVLETLANALQVLPDDRTQNIDEMRRGLSVSSAQTAAIPTSALNTAPKSPSNTPAPRSKQKKKNNSAKMYGLVAGIVTAFLLTAIIIFVLWSMGIIGGEDASSDTSSNGLTSQNFASQDITSKLPVVEFEGDYASLPNFKGFMFSDIYINHQFVDLFKFKISHQEYSDEYPAGQIISQTPAPNTTVEAGTTVELVVSLGPYYTTMLDLTGKYQETALMELLKAGFDYNNIYFEERYDDTKPAGTVLQTDPERGMSVNTEQRITVIINSYTGQSVEIPSSSESDTSSEPNLEQ